MFEHYLVLNWECFGQQQIVVGVFVSCSMIVSIYSIKSWTWSLDFTGYFQKYNLNEKPQYFVVSVMDPNALTVFYNCS